MRPDRVGNGLQRQLGQFGIGGAGAGLISDQRGKPIVSRLDAHRPFQAVGTGT